MIEKTENTNVVQTKMANDHTHFCSTLLQRLSFYERNCYCTNERWPFYDVVKPYLPGNRNSIIIDIGAGDGSFARHLRLADTYENLYVIDGNEERVESLGKSFKNAVYAQIPGRLPFDDSTVAFAHCSHMIEHLAPNELYAFLVEIDRVLDLGGVLVVSTPMPVAGQFYNDLSHVKPYFYSVLTKYLCGDNHIRTRPEISTRYTLEKLVYRYSMSHVGNNWGSSVLAIDILLRGMSKLLAALRVFNYERNGYTIVLSKGKS